MLTHEIKRYVVPEDPPPSRSTSVVPFQGWPHHQQRHNAFALNKHEYAQYILNLKIKKGDLVAGAGIQNITKHNVYIVRDIDEIHHFVEFTVSGPKCLALASYTNPGNVLFKSCPEHYRVVKEEDFIVDA